MIIVADFIFAFVLVRLIVCLTNLGSRLYLIKSGELPSSPSLSILIPVRNESSNIGNILGDLDKLNYLNFEILIYDDCSTDNTIEIIERYCCYNKRIKIIKGKNLPSGWLGKNHACYQLSNLASGDYLLFLDADVRVGADLIRRILITMQYNKVSLLSIFPMQIFDNKGSAMVVPLMNWILLSLLPLKLVKLSSWTSFAAANGQFMLFEAKIYKQLKPHKHVKNSKVEDIDICRYYKKNNQKVITLLGDEDVSCKMYDNREDAINGFAKNIFAIFGNSIVATILFFIATSCGSLIVYLTCGIYFIPYILTVLSIKILTSVMSKQNILKNLIYSIPQQYSLFTIIYTALKLTRHKTMKWKGRNISKIA